MSNICEWNVKNDTNIGSDHFPILCSLNFDPYIQDEYVIERWCFNKADWNCFKDYCIENLKDYQWRGM